MGAGCDGDIDEAEPFACPKYLLNVCPRALP